MTHLAVNEPASLRLADADFERLTQFFYQRTGIQFAPTKRYFVDKRVLACMQEYGFDDFAVYFAALRLGTEPGLLQRLVNALTINETYFFREDYQFDAMVRSVLPSWTATRGRRSRLRILSMGCSTGDEPYSIAMHLLESWPEIDTVDVEIVGADIDTRAVEAARVGVYSKRAVQRVPRSMLSRYFAPAADGRFQINADLSGAVRFVHGNVCDSHSTAALRDFDVIFCRNLLIYFDELSSRVAAENLYDCLVPGGFVFLGHAESMSRITGLFTPRRFSDSIAYQKPTLGVS